MKGSEFDYICVLSFASPACWLLVYINFYRFPEILTDFNSVCSQVIMSDIVNHRTSLDAATSQASLLIQSSEPQEACQLQAAADLDSINERYTKVGTRTKDHGIYLENLSRRLSNFEAELENLEHWLLPSGHELESNQIPQLPLIEFVNTLEVGFRKRVPACVYSFLLF